MIDVDKTGKQISTSAVSGGDPRVTRKKLETASRAAGCSTFPTCRCAIFPRLESLAGADCGGLSAMLRPARPPPVDYWPQVRAVLGNPLDPSTASCWGILLASCRSQRGRSEVALLYQILNLSTSNSNQNSAPSRFVTCAARAQMYHPVSCCPNPCFSNQIPGRRGADGSQFFAR